MYLSRRPSGLDYLGVLEQIASCSSGQRKPWGLPPLLYREGGEPVTRGYSLEDRSWDHNWTQMQKDPSQWNHSGVRVGSREEQNERDVVDGTGGAAQGGLDDTRRITVTEGSTSSYYPSIHGRPSAFSVAETRTTPSTGQRPMPSTRQVSVSAHTVTHDIDYGRRGS